MAKLTRGTVFRQAYTRGGKKKRTKTWYAKYYVGGKPVVVSAKTTDRDDAIAFLKRRVAEASSLPLNCYPERVRVGQLFDLMLEWYKMKGRRSTYEIKNLIEKKDGLRDYFGKLKAQALTSTAIARYVSSLRSMEKPPANGTINRHLSCLRRAMMLGFQQDPPLVIRVPKFEMLPEADPREGVVSYEQYREVRDLLPGYARIALVIGFHTGARKGEVTSLKRERVDFKAERIELPARFVKNKRPRFLPIYGDMAAELDMAIAAGDPTCPYLVQRDSKQVKDFKKSWVTACELAGVPKALFHDLRRTALTTMIEAGLSEKEAMEISGHRTRAVFDRYHIVSERRMKEMGSKMDAHMKIQAAEHKKKDAERQKEAVN